MIETFASTDEVLKRLGALIQNKAESSLSTGQYFKVGLSGGSLVKFLGKVLPTITTDWTKWRFFFCDERHVPFDNSESTYGIYQKEIFDKIPVTADNFIITNPQLTVEAAAEDYSKKIASFFPTCDFPKFDLLLLGMGPDGHTCSLFPNHELLKENVKWVAPIKNSPKPPPERVTLTLPVINNSQCCVFAITGAGKASTVKDVIENPGNLPASLVQPTSGELYWILDKDAASLLSKNT